MTQREWRYPIPREARNPYATREEVEKAQRSTLSIPPLFNFLSSLLTGSA